MTVEQALTLAFQHLQAGRLADAESLARAVIQHAPTQPEAYRVLGIVAFQTGHHQPAESLLRQAIALNPGVADYHDYLGIILQAQGRWNEAEAAAQQALAVDPNYAGAHNNLGMGFERQCRWAEAEGAFRKALELWPNFPEALVNLANVLQNQGRLPEAETVYRQALAYSRPSPGIENDLGWVLLAQSRLAEAQERFRRALALDPNFEVAHSNLLLCEHYRPDVTPEELLRAHAEWEVRHGTPLRDAWRPFANSRDPERPLRVGLVSADIGCHPVGFFLFGLLEALDHQQVAPIIYSGRRQFDEFTLRAQAVAAEWHNVYNIPHDQLAEKIRADGIDLLIDLAGHTSANRLLVFAHKPAPVQLTWMGYVGTTGPRAIDYLIADRYHIPEGDEIHYREQVLRLPDGYVCYTPPDYAPAVNPLPAHERGHVTFGSFGNPLKINPGVIAVWAEVLGRLPSSRLVLQYRGFDDPRTQQQLRDGFAGHGVDASRVDFRGAVRNQELLPQYHGIDIALDPFPYSGGLTTCEALWMGVPVITCPGRTFASRHSLSHLSNAGLAELVARDREDYVAKAAALAQDLPRLADLRAGMRERVARSPLCDAPRFASNFQAALRDVWRRWCREQPPA